MKVCDGHKESRLKNGRPEVEFLKECKVYNVFLPNLVEKVSNNEGRKIVRSDPANPTGNAIWLLSFAL
jgi:hypothetical protein